MIASATARGSDGGDDRPADHEIIGARGDRGRRRHDSLLIAGGGAVRADAGRHQHHVGAGDRAHGRGLFRRADQTIDPENARLFRACGDQCLYRRVVAGRLKVAVVIGGEHGDGENAQTAFARLDRGLHRLRIGMNRQEGRAEARDAFHALRDRIADVVQLEIEEGALAGAGKLLRVSKSARKSELVADLVERHGIAEPRHHGLRRLDRR